MKYQPAHFSSKKHILYRGGKKHNKFYSNLSKFITYVISYIIINYPKSPHHTPPPPHLSKSFFCIFEKSFLEMLEVVDKVEIFSKIKILEVINIVIPIKA